MRVPLLYLLYAESRFRTEETKAETEEEDLALFLPSRLYSLSVTCTTLLYLCPQAVLTKCHDLALFLTSKLYSLRHDVALFVL